MSNSSNNDFKIFQLAILNYVNTVVEVSLNRSLGPCGNGNANLGNFVDCHQIGWLFTKFEPYFGT